MSQQSNFLLLNPAIATLTGVNESIVLQQLYYWHQKYSFQKWIYNSYEEWQKQFSFWSIRTIRRIFTSLEKQGFIVSKRSKTCKFYRLCEDTIKKFFQNQDSPSCPARASKMAAPIYNKTKNIHKISSYKKKKQKDARASIEVNENNSNLVKTIISKWNEVFEYSLNPIKAYSNKTINKRLLDLYKNKFNSDLDQWEAYVKKINTSRFLMGEKETKNDFKAVFPWLIKEEIVDAILSDSYGVGDRKLDKDNLDENIKYQEKEVKQQFKEKVYSHLDTKLDNIIEEKKFKKYLMEKEYEKDGDRYSVKKHMEKIGKYYAYGGYITPSYIFYPGSENYRNKIFKSYLMAKYFGVDELSLESKFDSMFEKTQEKSIIFTKLKEIKNKIHKMNAYPCFQELHVPICSQITP